MAHIRRLAAVSAGFVALMLAAAAAAPPPAAPPESPSAQIQGAPKAQAAAPVEKAKPKMVCQEAQQIGSHFKRKICATPEDWEARRQRDQDEMQRMGGQATGCASSSGSC